MDSKSKFNIDSQSINTILKPLEEEEIALDKLRCQQVQIHPDTCKIQPFNNDFECSICKLVLWDPVECKMCQKMNCAWCIRKWQEQKSTCPNCRAPYQQMDVHLILKNLLAALNFRCKVCYESFKYKYAAKHYQQCGLKQRQCLF